MHRLGEDWLECLLDFLLLCRTDVCRCTEVVLIASVVYVEDNPVFYSGVYSVFPSVVVSCHLLSIGWVAMQLARGLCIPDEFYTIAH